MNRRAIVLLASTLLLVAAVATGCSGTSEPPSGKPGIVGTVSVLTPSGNNGVAFLVVTDQQTAQSQGYVADRAMVNVDDKTTIANAEGEKLEPKDVAVDMPVEVWFSGPLAESYPPQGTAGYIRVSSAKSAPSQE